MIYKVAILFGLLSVCIGIAHEDYGFAMMSFAYVCANIDLNSRASNEKA